MAGSLALSNGLLFVGSEEKTARVGVFDLDGHRVGAGFSFRDERLGRSSAAGLAVDEDRRVWVADTPASRVRCFSLFGREEAGLGLAVDAPRAPEDVRSEELGVPDARATIRLPVDVALDTSAEEPRLVVGCGGERRHAVQVYDGEGGYVFSPAPCGDPHGRYQGVSGVDCVGRWLFVAERAGARVQVFRDGAFHFSVDAHPEDAPDFAPVAVAGLQDGRFLILTEGEDASGLFLLDPAGRLLRVLATHGDHEGGVLHPGDVVVEEADREDRTRVVVVDQEAERVQVFTLDGRCYGAFRGRV